MFEEDDESALCNGMLAFFLDFSFCRYICWLFVISKALRLLSNEYVVTKHKRDQQRHLLSTDKEKKES